MFLEVNATAHVRVGLSDLQPGSCLAGNRKVPQCHDVLLWQEQSQTTSPSQKELLLWHVRQRGRLAKKLETSSMHAHCTVLLECEPSLSMQQTSEWQRALLHMFADLDNLMLFHCQEMLNH